MTTPCQRKLCSADQAAGLIQDGQTVACGGFVGAAHPEAITHAIERRFLAEKAPRDLRLFYGAGQGDGRDRGLNHLGYEGLVQCVIGGHWALAPKLGRLAIEGKIQAYNFPQGVLCELLRDIAAGRPGLITHIGLDTFVDPDHGGGRLNDITPPAYVRKMQIDGKDYLFYESVPIHVALIRATAADPFGNLAMNDEAIIGEVLPMAQAAHNCGGIVIAQVKELLDTPLRPQLVRVPGVLVDHIVVADPAEHEQTFAEIYNASFNEAASEDAPAQTMARMPLDARRIIAARACDELPHGAIVNLGIGMPEGIANIAAERNLLQQVTLTVESGPIGGMPAGGLSFGASHHPQAIIDQPAQFDFYDGRGLDFAALGSAQIDRLGNVNVSRFGPKLAGVGGFVNITQTAKRLVFCGTFTAGGLDVAVEQGQLRILAEGRSRKFVHAVEQISFSAHRSRQIGQDVLYVTERAVFKLTDQGLRLIEIAPGVDLQRDILDQMAFTPIVDQPALMPAHVLAMGSAPAAQPPR